MRILFALDGQKSDATTLNFAASLQFRNASAHLLHVQEPLEGTGLEHTLATPQAAGIDNPFNLAGIYSEYLQECEDRSRQHLVSCADDLKRQGMHVERTELVRGYA